MIYEFYLCRGEGSQLHRPSTSLTGPMRGCFQREPAFRLLFNCVLLNYSRKIRVTFFWQPMGFRANFSSTGAIVRPCSMHASRQMAALTV